MYYLQILQWEKINDYDYYEYDKPDIYRLWITEQSGSLNWESASPVGVHGVSPPTPTPPPPGPGRVVQKVITALLNIF
jgi:hypothetical protein